MNLTDQQLLHDWCVRRDAEAFQAIVQRHAAMVYHTALRVLRNASDAEDTAQACFETLAEAKEPAKIQSLGAWLHGMATNQSLNLIRTDNRRIQRERRYSEETPPFSEPANWDDIYPLVDEAVLSLDESLRVPIVTHFLEGKSHGEIADELNVGRSAITKRIGKGVDQIESFLKKKGVTPGAGFAAAFASNLSSTGAAHASLLSTLGKIAIAQGGGTAGTAAMGATASWLFFGKVIAVGLVAILGGGLVIQQFSENPISVAPVAQIDAPVDARDSTEIDSATRFGQTSNVAVDSGSSSSVGNFFSIAEDRKLENWVTVSGSVSRPDGTGVADAPVSAGWHGVSLATNTNADGFFSLDLPKNNYGDGPLWFSRKVDHARHLEEAAFVGKVQGNSLSGVLDLYFGEFSVEGKRNGSGEGALGSWTTKTNFKDDEREGTYEGVLTLERTQNGSITGSWKDGLGPADDLSFYTLPKHATIQSQFETFTTGTYHMEVPPEGRDDMHLTLMTMGTISGKIVDANGKPLKQWQVSAHHESTASFHMESLDKNGEFAMEDLVPGFWNLFAQDSRGSNIQKRVYLPDDGRQVSTTITYGADFSGTLSGRVIDVNGAGIADATIVSQALNPALQAKTDTAGSFTMSGFEPGIGAPLSVEVRADGFVVNHVSIHLQDNSTTDIVLERRPELTGFVIDAARREPIVHYRIVAWSDRGTNGNKRSLSHNHQIPMSESEDGSFELKPNILGDFIVCVSAPGFLSNFVTLSDVGGGTLRRGIEIELTPAQPIRGRVVDPEGDPIRDVGIYPGPPPFISSMVYRDEDHVFARTDADGFFEVVEYSPHLETLSAYRLGYAPVSVKREIDGQPVNFVMDKGVRVSGIIHRNGERISSPKARVFFFMAGSRISYEFSKKNGTYSLNGVPRSGATLGVEFNSNPKITITREVDNLTKESMPINFDYVQHEDTVIEGKIVSPFEDLEVRRVKAVPRHMTGDQIEFSVRPRKDGSYRFRRIPEDEYVVSVRWYDERLGDVVDSEPFFIRTDIDRPVQHDIQIIVD